MQPWTPVIFVAEVINELSWRLCKKREPAGRQDERELDFFEVEAGSSLQRTRWTTQWWLICRCVCIMSHSKCWCSLFLHSTSLLCFWSRSTPSKMTHWGSVMLKRKSKHEEGLLLHQCCTISVKATELLKCWYFSLLLDNIELAVSPCFQS